MLFAPGRMCLLRYEGASPVGVNRLGRPEEEVDEGSAALCAELAPSSGISVREGRLAVPLDSHGQRVALVVLEDFAQRGREGAYRNLLETIAPICALSLNNARNYEALRKDEIALRSKQEDLLRALDLRDRLFSIVGHDLRGPVGAILGLLQYIKEVHPDFRILADQATIATVLRNLVSNALRYTPAGGSVSVRSKMDGERRLLEIADTGVGMDAPTLSRAFDPADRRSRRGTNGDQGTGLGLLLCRDFMELNGGSIRLDSEPGKGTRVTLEFQEG